jgi:hypothetical protein
MPSSVPHAALTFIRPSPGWIIISIVLAVLASLLALFPKTLPRAAVRRMMALEKQKSSDEPELPTSVSGKKLARCNLVFRKQIGIIGFNASINPRTLITPHYTIVSCQTVIIACLSGRPVESVIA